MIMPTNLHARGEGVKRMQRLAKGVERQRLHVIRDVRVRLPWITAGERAELRRRHAQRSRLPQRVLEQHLRLPP